MKINKDASENLSDVILHHLLDGIVIINRNGIIKYANKAAETLFGKQSRFLVGRNFGFPVSAMEIQEIEIVRKGTVLHIEMLSADISWKGEPAFVTSLRDVSEKKKLERKLKAAGLQLQRTSQNLKKVNTTLLQSNEALTQFAHVASHDLKEPVRKIRMFTNLIERDCDSDLTDACKHHVKRIDAAANRMFTMIDGVLIYSSLNAAKEPLKQIDLNELVEEVKVDLEILLLQKNAVVHCDALPSIEGARVLIHQLFYNLMSNALKFSRPNTTCVINISSEEFVKKSEKFVRIIMKDNGIGFSEKQAKVIFNTFTRLHSKDKYEGTGLGLSLCKRIVLRHGGKITAHGEENKGAAFHIVLPVKQKGAII